MKPSIHFVRPSSQEQPDLLGAKLDEFTNLGYPVTRSDISVDPAWPYCASSIEERARSLTESLQNRQLDILWAARGGYGASDLLPLLPYDQLRTLPEKRLVGFSDISALHSALFTKLGWRGLHAPMPASNLWGENGRHDIEATLAMLSQQKPALEIELQPITERAESITDITGINFGGCLSVLSSLIGTEYFPNKLKGYIVFLEDLDETPPRLMRMLNTWQHAGFISEVGALIFGAIRTHKPRRPDAEETFFGEIARRFRNVPVFRSGEFGHVSPNKPIPIGVESRITRTGDNQVQWSPGKLP